MAIVMPDLRLPSQVWCWCCGKTGCDGEGVRCERRTLVGWGCMECEMEGCGPGGHGGRCRRIAGHVV